MLQSSIDITKDEELIAAWEGLSPAARDVLAQLCKRGPTWDGDLVSKSGRDELLEKGFAAKMVMGNAWLDQRRLSPRPSCEWGFQAATYLGAHVWKASPRV